MPAVHGGQPVHEVRHWTRADESGAGEYRAAANAALTAKEY
jgi:hypothetical protein